MELDAPGRVYIEYAGPAGALRSATTPAPARAHRVPVVRLLPDTGYRYAVVPVAGDDTPGTPAAAGRFRTRALPPALARLRIDVTGESTAELVLLDLQDNPDSFFLFLDSLGRIVWYHRNRPVVADPPTPIRAVRQKPNHNLVYWEGGPTGRFVNCCLREIDPLGRVVTRLVNNDIDKWAHHDLLILPDEQVALHRPRDRHHRRHRAGRRGGDPRAGRLAAPVGPGHAHYRGGLGRARPPVPGQPRPLGRRHQELAERQLAGLRRARQRDPVALPAATRSSPSRRTSGASSGGSAARSRATSSPTPPTGSTSSTPPPSSRTATSCCSTTAATGRRRKEASIRAPWSWPSTPTISSR